MKAASTSAETLTDWALLQLIPRVIHSSGQSAALFIVGLLIRLLERLLSLGPFIVSFLWLQQFLPVAALIKLPAALTPLALPQVCLMLLVMLLLQLVCSYCGQLFCFQGAYQIMSGYRDHAVSKVRTLPLHVLQEMQIGASADVLTDDIKKVESIFTHIAADLLIALTTPLLMLAVLTLVEWRLALSLCITLPLGWYLLQTFRARLMQLGLKKAAGFRATSALLIEFISGLTTLKLFNAVPAWQQKLESRFALMQQDSTHVEAWGAGPVLLYRISIELGLVIMLLTAGIMQMQDLFNPLHFLLFALLAYKILDGLLDAAAFLTVLRMAAQSEQHIQALLQTPTLSEPAAAQQPQHHEIAFKHVYFSYAGAEAAHSPWHLQDINFTLPERGMLAIVGSSGAGKSTVASLLARFFDPQQGSISIGGVDLRAMGTTLLYQHISVVFQDVQLFDSTILDNVRIGRLDASDDEVIAACQAANCHHFIQRLQDGYQTTIGESGFSLSGGERQRLSIARAMLRDAPILLLDEATASLDVESQHEVQQALSRLVADKTVITIAHRLSTISHANQILVLQQGRIAEHGRHEELLLRGGIYANLWRTQQHAYGQG